MIYTVMNKMNSMELIKAKKCESMLWRKLWVLLQFSQRLKYTKKMPGDESLSTEKDQNYQKSSSYAPYIQPPWKRLCLYERSLSLQPTHEFWWKNEASSWRDPRNVPMMLQESGAPTQESQQMGRNVDLKSVSGQTMNKVCATCLGTVVKESICATCLGTVVKESICTTKAIVLTTTRKLL